MSTFPKSDSSYSNTRRSLRARLELRGMLWCRPSFPVHLVPPRHARMCGRVRFVRGADGLGARSSANAHL